MILLKEDSMEETIIYLKPLNRYNFRYDRENAKVIGFIMYTPKSFIPTIKYNPRPCFKVKYESDGFIDYIAYESVLDGQWEFV
jgi:hypothetical protein